MRITGEISYHITRLALLLAATSVLGTARAQLTVQSQTDLQALARDITGPGVTISNPQINCDTHGYGEFQYSGPLLGIDEGVLLTTGTITNAIGPNNAENTTYQQNTPGNSILNLVTGRTTYDACKFEFDVIPAGDTLRFDFVFGSEEYNEWVGSQYNDVFGFFISGPGITGDPGIGNDRNIALVPGTSQAVTINNVNNGSNQAYYHDNAGGQFIQYDGITRGLSATSPVQPCSSYHLKLIVADASDRKYDSGVFIAKVKSNPVTMQAFTENGGPDLIEGCNAGSVRFTRQLVTSLPLTLEYYLQGSATNGTDYTAIGDPDPTVAKTITIPANSAYVDQPINPIADGIAEGMETLRFILGNPNCPGSALDSLVIDLTDSLNATVQPQITSICQGGEVQLTAAGGASYTWSPAAGLSAVNIPDPLASPLSTTMYSVTVQAGGCSSTLHSQVKVSHLALSAAITAPLCNGADNGAINLSVAGGLPPYSYQWSGPGGFTATTQDISAIATGTYTVTINDGACSRTQSFNVGQPPPLSASLSPSLLVFGQNIACHGASTGAIDATIAGGTGPYTTSWTGPNGFTSSSVDINGLAAGTYALNITDAGGCATSANTTLLQATPIIATVGATTNVACANAANGSVTVAVSGGTPVYRYEWNTTPVQSGSTATGLAPGNYSVAITDQYGCATSTTATIHGPAVPVLAILTAKTDVACFGADNGSAATITTGGTPPYSYSWNTVPLQNGPNASSLSGGNYTLTVTDANGCGTGLTVMIETPAQALATAITNQMDVACFGSSTGGATVSASGGSAPYSWSWNTVPSHNGASVTGLQVGTYTATVTDIHGCSTAQQVVIAGPAAALNATIGATNNAHCAGNTDGSAIVTATGGTDPYTYTWNTSPVQTNATAADLGAGTWTVNVTDANHCSAVTSATIAAPAVMVIAGAITQAQCQGAANGAVIVTTTGGTTPYAWAWTGPAGYSATTEDLSGLNAGGYSLTVTDVHGCYATRSFDVNQPGLFTVSAMAAIHGTANVTCIGATDGSINLTVSGAVPPYSYSWSGPSGFTAGSQDLNGLGAGSYSVTITDANGCSTSEEVTVQAPQPVTIQLTASDHHGSAISCAGGANGTITSSISGGNAPYTTAWTGPSAFTSSQSDLSGLSAGTYSVTVTDANGCAASGSIVLGAPAQVTVASSGIVPQTCFGSGTGQATVSASGGTGPYSYAWSTSPVQHGATAAGLQAGAYNVAVTDNNGCTATTAITVVGPTAPLSMTTTSLANVLCNMGQSGVATVQATGGTAPYSYLWNTSPSVSGPTASGLSAGSWTVAATDAHACATSMNIVITQPAQPLSAILVDLRDVTCAGDANGTASINVSGGSGNYKVNWNTTPAHTGTTVNGLTPGNYVATVADANGCTQTLALPISIGGPVVPLAISYAIGTYPGGGNVSCIDAHDGSIDANVTGGTAPYSYYWTNGTGSIQTTEDLQGLVPGTYNLILSDGHGCLADTVATLVTPVALSATATVHPAICHGASDGSIDLSVAGGAAPYAYQWAGPGGFSAATQDLNTIAAGVYFTSITDANGCHATQPFDVTEPGTFSFSATLSSFPGGNNTSCHSSTDGSITLVANGGTTPYDYAWSGPNGFSATTTSINGLSAGAYHLVLTDVNGCSALSSHLLTAPTALSAFSISNKGHGGYDLSCAGNSDGQIGTTVSGGTPPYAFAWTGPGGFTASTADISGLSAGTYQLTVTDANGCSVMTGNALVAPPALSATASIAAFASGNNISCAGAENGAVTISPSGGSAPIAVLWSGPSGFVSTAWQITGLAPGSYSAHVTDNNGCSLTIDRTLSTPSALALATSTIDAACHDGVTGSIGLTVSGGSPGYAYQWTGPGTYAGTSQDVLNVAAGTYSVTVTDVNGCSAITSADISQPTAITAIADVTTTVCQGSNNGVIDLNVSGGTNSYTFFWTGFPAYSATTQDIDSLFAGVYTVAITDENGCTATENYNVGEPGLFNINAEMSSHAGGYNVSCAGAHDGSIDATVTGGLPSYTYFWNGPNGFTSIQPDITGLAAGEYTLTVHDANGCNASASFTLTAPTAIAIGLAASIYPGGSNTGCDGSTDGSIDASIAGGISPYSIAWAGPDGPLGIGEDLVGVGAGNYSITVTDAAGCTATTAITLIPPQGLSATEAPFTWPNGANLTCATSSDGSIALNIAGGSAPFHVAWSGPGGFNSSNEDISGLAAGTYTALITDANGCSTAAQVALVAPLPLALSNAHSQYSGGFQVSCSGSSDGTIMTGITGGSPGYQLQWTGPNGFSSSQPALTGLEPGSYTVQVTDASGCSANSTVNLASPPPIIVSADISDHVGFEVGCAGNDGSITLNASGGQPSYQYNWAGPNGFASQSQDLQQLPAGSYTVAITDGNGCSVQRSYALAAAPALFSSLGVTSNECDQSSNGAIDLTVSGGISPYGIEWSGPQGFSSTDSDLTGLASGRYIVSITSALGCSITDSAYVIAASPMTMALFASDLGAVNIPCKGDSSGTVELSVQGGFQPVNIMWTGPSGFTSDTTSLSGLIAGTYLLHIADAHGCISDTSLTLTETATPLILSLTASSFPSGTNIACHGNTDGSIDATVSGGDSPYIFAWRGPDSTSFETEDLNGIGAGAYELVVTDGNQCATSAHVLLNEPDTGLQAVLNTVDHNGYGTSCEGSADGEIDMAVLGGSSGYLVQWTGPNGFISMQDSITELVSGTYSITATDANGCTLTQDVTIQPPPAIVPNLIAGTFASGSNIRCAGMNDGTVAATVTGGAGQLALSWSGPVGFTSTDSSINGLSAGTYCLSVTDENGCQTQTCKTLVAPDTLHVVTIAAAASCGTANGAVQTVTTGGGTPFIYQWNSGQDSGDLVGIPAGAYSLTVTDANGCVATASATVTGTPAVSAAATVTEPLCHDDNNGVIDLTVNTGTAPYSYLWNGTIPSEDLGNVSRGIYSIIVTDANGCLWDTTYEVTAPAAIGADSTLSIYAGGHNISTSSGSDGSISVSPNGGTVPYTFAWNTGASSASVAGLSAGIYTVTVTDAHGCSRLFSFTLTGPDVLEMPSGFTPNGDGNNDAYIVHGIGGFPNNQLTVFNRWGNVVFDQLNYTNNWRGENQQGQPLPDGTYFVVIKLDEGKTMQHYVDLRR